MEKLENSYNAVSEFNDLYRPNRRVAEESIAEWLRRVQMVNNTFDRSRNGYATSRMTTPMPIPGNYCSVNTGSSYACSTPAWAYSSVVTINAPPSGVGQAVGIEQERQMSVNGDGLNNEVKVAKAQEPEIPSVLKNFVVLFLI